MEDKIILKDADNKIKRIYINGKWGFIKGEENCTNIVY